MTYYNDQQKANKFLHEFVTKKILVGNETISVESLLYQITLEHAVSEKKLLERLEIMCKTYPALVMKDGFIQKEVLDND